MGLYAAAIAAALVAALPFLWGTITALKQDADLYNVENAPFVFNLAPTLEHVSFLLEETQFLTFAWNTLWVGLRRRRDHARGEPARRLQPRRG